MKKLYALSTGVLLSSALIAQSFTDDFESYTPGDYVGQQSTEWTTWSGTTGGTEDAQVVTTKAFSGNNSIYFNSSNQGPQDVVLPFGGAYDNGLFKYEMMLYIDNNTDCYFNFQAESTIGQTWAMDCNIQGDGSMSMSNQGGSLLNGSFPTGQWARLSYEINLNLNKWEVFVDSVSIGSFANTVNKIASLDIFPLVIAGSGSSSSSFWIDDVYYSYETITLPNLNAAPTGITGLQGLATSSKAPIVTVKNLGTTNVTSFDIEVEYEGNTISESISGIDIASLETIDIEMSQALVLAAGSNNISATISNVNGNASDDDASDDVFTTTVDPVVPAPHKRVLVEEATGTWCQWCPRGAVWMAIMQERYPEHFVGVAVHNNDPMEDATYDTGIGTLISGYPSSVVDRGADIDPSAMEPDFIERVQESPSGKICLQVDYTEGASTFDVNMLVTLLDDVTPAWKIGFIITEDSVTGSTSGYNQSNAYAGGGSGELSGAGLDWHNEPSSVPASKMVYNHVGRMIAPGFAGKTLSFPNGGVAGDTFWFKTTIAIGSEWDLEHLHVAGALFDASGRSDNARTYHFDEIQTGHCDGFPLAVNEINSEATERIDLFPNPVYSQLTIQINHAQKQLGSIRVLDMLGKTVYSENIPSFDGVHQHSLDVSSLNAGLYMLEYFDGKEIQTQRFIKK